MFPAGTANDFAHYFEIPTDLDSMLEIAVGDNYIPADIGCCNGKYFVNVAAIGSVIDVSQKTDATMKNALGPLAYYIRALGELPSLHPVEVTITTPGTEIYAENIFHGRPERQLCRRIQEARCSVINKRRNARRDNV